MPTVLLLVIVAALQAVTLFLVLRRRAPSAGTETAEALRGWQTGMRDEFERSRREAAAEAREGRAELEQRLDAVRDGLARALAESRAEFGAQFKAQADMVDRRLADLGTVTDRRLQTMQEGSEAGLAAVRESIGQALADQRNELAAQFRAQAEAVDRRLAELRDATDKRLQALQEGNQAKLDAVRGTVGGSLAEYRAEMAAQFTAHAETVARGLAEVRQATDRRLEMMQHGQEAKMDAVRDTVSRSLSEHRGELGGLLRAQAETVDRRLAEVRETVEKRLEAMQQGNEARLEEMRRTVDEKLQNTLEKRLGESFVMVAERLEKVHDGLGQMRALAGNVLDLSRILSNVKDRGTFGEVQLGNLLDQVLGERQYEVNVAVSPERPDQRVEFALRLPSRERAGQFVLLPIDAKFPLEDYRRLAAAQRAGDAEAAEAAAKALASTVLQEAKKIRDKYICPPATTDFAFMFLPTEGLYAEVASRPDVMDRLREYRVVPAGPINLYALVDIVGMVHRFMAVQEQAGRVWELLAAVKTEFGRFGDVLTSVKRKIDSASSEFDKVDVRTRAIARRLREVQELPADRMAGVLALEAAAAVDAEEPVGPAGTRTPSPED